jgi:hypothetical protein
MLNHQTFAQFKNLGSLDLSGNLCIDKKFEKPDDFAGIEREFVVCEYNLKFHEKFKKLEREVQEVKLKVDQIWELTKT